MEAMSVGRPVVASDVGSGRDGLHAGINGLLVRPREPSDMASALIELLSPKLLRP